MGNILKKIEEEYSKPIYLGVVALHAVRRSIDITLFYNFDWADRFLSLSLYLIFAICFAKLAIDLITNSMNKHAVNIFLAGFVVLLIIYFFSNSISGLFFWIILCASHNVDYDDIIKTASITMAVILAIVFIGCALGVLDNLRADQGGDRIRYSLGFIQHNLTSHFTFYTIIAWLYWRKEKITWVELIACMSANAFVFTFANTKNPFYIGTLAIVIAALFKIFSGLRQYKKAYGVVAITIHPICALGVIILTTLYHGGIDFWDRLNGLLTGRLSLGLSAINNYGISAFGQAIRWIGYGTEYNIVDSSYLYVLITNGVVFLLMALAMFVIMGIKSIKKRDTYFMLATVAVALHGTFDQCLLSIGYDVFIYFMAYLFADTYSNSDNETEGMESNYMRDTIVKIWKNKWLVLACIIICAGAGAVIGYKNGQKQQTELQAEYEELVKSAQSEYDSKIAEYDNNIKNVNLEVAKAQKQVDSVEDYVNNSVYMKLNPSSICTHAVNIEVIPTEKIDAEAVAAKLGDYITSGSVYGDLDEELDAKHWNDIVNVSVAGNNICVTVMNTDESSAKVCANALVDALRDYAETQINVVSDESYVKTDVNIGYNQNTHRNNYYSYVQNLNNQVKSKTDQENAKAAYEEAGVDAIVKSKVEESKKEYDVSPVKRAMAYAILGVLIGLILSAILVWIVGIIREDREDKKYSK